MTAVLIFGIISVILFVPLAGYKSGKSIFS